MDQLDSIRGSLEASFELRANVNLGFDVPNFDPIGSCGSNDCSNVADNVPFRGTLDGAGFSITNLHVLRPFAHGAGLFALTDGALLYDLHLVLPAITGMNWVGAIVGHATDTRFEGIQVTDGMVSAMGEGAGAIAGFAHSESQILHCRSDASVDAAGAFKSVGDSGTVGGLVGFLVNSFVGESTFTGDADADIEVGGLVGFCLNSALRDSFASSILTAQNDTVGGLVGRAETCAVQNCYAAGDITGPDIIGGIVGQCVTSDIHRSFFTGDLHSSGTNIGGMVGGWDATCEITVAAWRDGGGSAVDCYPDGNFGCTAAGDAFYFQDRINSPMDLWDFDDTTTDGTDDIWTMRGGPALPLLTWLFE